MATAQPPTQPLRGKQLAQLFFTRVSPTSNVWRCKCGTERTQSTSGYTNLCSHVQTSHPEYIHLTDNSPESVNMIANMLIPRAVRKVFGWLQWIVFSMLPFSFCENDMTRKFSKLESISTGTFMKYMSKMSDCVEKKIALLLPSMFAIVFDGWSIGSTHYVAIFATFSSDDAIGYKKVLLSFSPINDEDSLSAIAHHDYLTFVLDIYGKNLSNVVALIGDNCPTNRALARHCKLPLVGCASHRFNLFVNDILTDHEPLLDIVNELMKRLKHLIPAAKLRRLTPLVAVTRNVTRWSSTYEMLRRYADIKTHIRLVRDKALYALLPTDAQDAAIDDLLATLEELNSATLALQAEDTTLEDARNLFDEAMLLHPRAASRLATDAEIVDFPNFENGVVKILGQSADRMSDGERESVGRLLRPADGRVDVTEERLSLAERAKKRLKTSREDAGYMDCRFIRPTSNMCERFFSWAKYALSDRRRGTTPQNFEQQMFLKANSALWDVTDVASVMEQ